MKTQNNLLIIDSHPPITPITFNQDDEQDRLYQSDQQQPPYEIHRPKMLSSRFAHLPAIILIILASIAASYLYTLLPRYSSQLINGTRYNLLPTAYPKDLASYIRPPEYSLQQPHQERIVLYLQEQQIQQYSNTTSSRYVDSLIGRGKMLDELQGWLLDNIRGHQSCLVFWSEGMAVAAVLLGQLLRQRGGGEILLLVDRQQQGQLFEGFKVTVRQYNLQGLITILNTVDWVVPQKMSYYNIIVTAAPYFHNNIISSLLRQLDPFTLQLEQQLSSSFAKQYQNTRIVVLYDALVPPTQLHQLQTLKNRIYLLRRYDHMPFYQLAALAQTSSFIWQDPNIVFISNQIKQATDGSKKQPASTPTNPNQPDYQDIQQQQSAETIHKDIKTNPSGMTQIRRLSPDDIKSKLVCTKPDVVSSNQTRSTMFQQIELPIHSKYEGQAKDYSHLAKFLASYYEVMSFSSSTFYCMQSQMIVNLVAVTSRRNVFIPLQLLQNQHLIQRSLILNRQSNYIMIDFKLEESIKTFKENQMRLMLAQLKYLEQWSHMLELLLKLNMDIIVRRDQSKQQTELVQSYLTKGFKLYIIFPRITSQFDYSCIKDYQMELINFYLPYPPNSFYLITNNIINIDSFDPVQFIGSKIRRITDIRPYQCALPPYSSKQQVIDFKNYYLTDNKYHLPVYLEYQETLMYKQVGAIDEDFIQFINSCLVSSDTVLFHSEAAQNMLLVVSLLKKIKPYGSVTFTSMPNQKQAEMMRNLERNDVQTSCQLLKISSESVIEVKQYIFAEKPSLIITTMNLFLSYQQILEYLPKGVLIALKYVQDELYQEAIKEMSKKYSAYHIVTQTKETLPYNRCQDYKTVILTPEYFSQAQPNWIFFQI